MNAADLTSHPSLSVIVVRFVGGAAMDRTLEALASQRNDGMVDVVVAHRADDAPTGEQRARFPWARFVAGEQAAPPSRLRTLGVKASVGGVVACTEDHCIPAADWCARVLDAHARGVPVVGGAIDKAPTADGAAWAAYLLDYARYMSPLAAGPAAYVSDCNVSYDRAALERVADVWSEAFHETSVHWALARHGIGLQLDPAIVVYEHREVHLAEYLRERNDHGRTFALTRVEGASGARRLRFALTALLLPPVIVLRIVRRLRGSQAPSGVPTTAWLPLLRSAVAWSMGELRGYVGPA